MALNIFAEEIPSKPVTLPRFNLPDIDIEAEAREAAERVAERRIIRAGRDALLAIGKAGSFENWKAIGAALAIGKAQALRATGANDTSARAYITWFSRWLVSNGFGRVTPKTRSWAIQLHEHGDAITAWRDSLPEATRKRLKNPQSVIYRWRVAQQINGYHCPADWAGEARAAWRKFVRCVSCLPPDQAAPLWDMVHQTKAAADAA